LGGLGGHRLDGKPLRCFARTPTFGMSGRHRFAGGCPLDCRLGVTAFRGSAAFGDWRARRIARPAHCLSPGSRRSTELDRDAAGVCQRAWCWLAQQKTERAPKVFSYCERCGGPVLTPPRVGAADFRRGAAGDPQITLRQRRSHPRRRRCRQGRRRPPAMILRSPAMILRSPVRILHPPT
jgi:hypothetical protein